MSKTKQYCIINTTSNLYYNEMFGWHPTQGQLYDTSSQALNQIEKMKIDNCVVRCVSVNYELIN